VREGRGELAAWMEEGRRDCLGTNPGRVEGKDTGDVHV
jgi:hypothetical protein